MTTGRAIHRADDGTETDVTEGVQALYDLVLGSLNWSSGFWSWEDAVPVGALGRLLGFDQIEEVERYIAKRRDESHQWDARTFRLEHPECRTVRKRGEKPKLVPHDHVYSSVGRCMWPLCEEKQHET